MATFGKFNAFVADLGNGVHNFSSHTLKVMLTNTAPVATNSVKTDITDISAGNGYTAGGTATTVTSWSQTSGTAKLVCADVTWTATGSIGPFRYAVLYNDSSTNKSLIGYFDSGAAKTLANGDTFTVDFDATNGVLTIG